MVLPVVASQAARSVAQKGARQAAKGAAASRTSNVRLNRIANDNDLGERVSSFSQDASEPRPRRSFIPRTGEDVTERFGGRGLQSLKLPRPASLMETAKAVRASWTIAAAVMPFYVVQLVFALITIAGLAAEYAGESFLWGLGSYVVPGLEIFAAGFVITPLIGLAFMFTAALLYSFQNVSWWRTASLLMFILCTIFYFIPLLNLVPWVLVWMFVVVRTQME